MSEAALRWGNWKTFFETLPDDSTRCWIVSPFLTTLPQVDLDKRVRVLTRAAPQDFLDGSTSAELLQRLITAGVEVRRSPRLNAKCYGFHSPTRSEYWAGSPNMTRAAETSNLEMIVGPLRPDEEFLAQLEAHWEQASPLTEYDLKLLIDLQGLAKPWLGRRDALTDLENVRAHLHDPEELVTNVFSDITEGFASPNPFGPEDVISGFRELDAITHGFEAGSLTVVGGRPAMGKTGFAITVALTNALRRRIPVLYLSPELTAKQMMNRMLSAQGRVDMSRVRMGTLSDRDLQRLADAAGVVAESPFFVDDTPELTLPLLEFKARQFAHKNPQFLLVVDYLQLVAGGRSGPFEGRQGEVAEISRRLKILARELSIPVIALSQLSRAVETRPNKRPMLSDLRESGGLEQDADLVLFVYRDEYYDPQSEKQGIAEIIIGKQRNGPIGTIELQFHNSHVRFNDFARGEA